MSSGSGVDQLVSSHRALDVLGGLSRAGDWTVQNAKPDLSVVSELLQWFLQSE